MPDPDNITVVDDGNYERTIEDAGVCLLYFWADWCGPCMTLDLVLDELAEAHPELLIAKVDADANEAALEAYGVESIPMMILFERGDPVDVFPGKVSFATLDTGVEPYL